MSIRNVITKIKVKKWIKDGLSVGENVKRVASKTRL